jgi:hypothetical protein
MQGQHAGLDVMAFHGVGDELLGQLGALALGEQPAHDVTAEDVQDHVQVKARPLGRALKLGVSQDHTRLGASASNSGRV